MADCQNVSPRPQAAQRLLENPCHRLMEFVAWLSARSLCWSTESTFYRAAVLLSVPLFSQSLSVQLKKLSPLKDINPVYLKKDFDVFICLFVSLFIKFILFGGCNGTPNIQLQVSLDFVYITPQNVHNFAQTFSWHSSSEYLLNNYQQYLMNIRSFWA